MTRSQLFTAAHALARKVRQAGDDYRVTFGACVRHILAKGLEVAPSVAAFVIERVGRRSYIVGDTYPHKAAIRAAGGHWDSARRAWWMGSADKAAALIARLGSSAPKASARYTKLADGSWGLRGRHLVAGGSVEVRKASGETKTETVASILSTDAQGWQTATIARRASAPRRSGGYRGFRSFRSADYCGYPCPVTGQRCTASNPCHDCR